MRTILEAAQDGIAAPTRVLLLPAAYTGPEDFVREGFVRAVRERRLAVDLVFVELTLPHLTDRTMLRRLRDEIVLPARATGCRSIWLGGISLGGFIALAYAARFTQEIDGLCLLAPYLGNQRVIGEIARADGVDGWTAGDLAEDDDERRIWQFIKEQRDRSAAEEVPRSAGGGPRGDRTSASPAVALHLGFGSEDRFAASHRLMAAALAPSSVDVGPGGHEWPAWRRLWENFLDTRFPVSHV
ncbi:MAG TPA: alpha/beta fold hydrolase [Steroidobacteraceae bacterium]